MPRVKPHIESDDALKHRIKSVSTLRGKSDMDVEAVLSHYSGAELDALCHAIDLEPRRVWST
jgi:hypothetical protein